MDVALARTFLEVAAQGSFVAAAQRLHLTQTAVSARVKNLEEQLGATLFVRHKTGTTLTPAGERFAPYASSLLQMWERARQQVALPPGRAAGMALGCEPSLWDPVVPQWLVWMKAHAPQFAVRTEIRASAVLLERILNGTLDLAILYAPPHRPGLRVELLLQETLVLVTTDPLLAHPAPDHYVHVDWSPDFSEQHARAFPHLARPAVWSDFGPLACDYLLAAGGAGYFRSAVVQRHIAAGRLHRVPGAPEFPYPAYAVHAEEADPSVLAHALEGLRDACARPGPQGI